MAAGQYVGRFAPSPTGPLHFGSLAAALASYLDARHNDGRWLVRVEDIDPPREYPGATGLILDTLRQLGLNWDDEVLMQSARMAVYRGHVDQLLGQDQAYRCRCTRSQLRNHRVYPGTCRQLAVSADEPHCVRVIADHEDLIVADALQGTSIGKPATEFGDFIIWRRDDLPAYQLAVTIDDAYQQITHIVRGADLLDSTSRQVYLRKVFGFANISHAHIPVAVGSDNRKLSKQNRAPAVVTSNPVEELCRALKFLRQPDPPPDARSSVLTLLEWATNRWRISNLYGVMQQKNDFQAY